MEHDVLLEMKNISKEFPGVKALDNVSLTVRRGTVHALMGENGAGKSTLIHIVLHHRSRKKKRRNLMQASATISTKNWDHIQ